MSERIQYVVVFCKKALLRFISHLDLVNVFDRALRRSKLPIYYTQGFNPKIKISFVQARRLGEEIENDTLSISLLQEISPDILRDTLNELLPKDIQVLHVTKKEK